MGRYKIYILIGIAVLTAALGAVYYFYLMPRSSEKPTEVLPQSTGKEAQSGSAVEPAVEPIEVDLDKSDDLVRELVRKLSSNPGLSRWLVTDHLIRRFVSIVDVIANGGSPRRDVNFVDFKGEFKVEEAGGEVFLDPNTYRRYNRIADIFVSLDTDGCVTLYRQLRQPIRQAYSDLGYPEEDFNATLKKAILELLQTPIVENRIYLKKDVLTYKIADPELEQLSRAQKHLLRMGPDNMRAVQSKLREIAQKLGFLE
jgi:hypothetical protein